VKVTLYEQKELDLIGINKGLESIHNLLQYTAHRDTSRVTPKDNHYNKDTLTQLPTPPTRTRGHPGTRR
jgi:hypothetical protein